MSNSCKLTQYQFPKTTGEYCAACGYLVTEHSGNPIQPPTAFDRQLISILVEYAGHETTTAESIEALKQAFSQYVIKEDEPAPGLSFYYDGIKQDQLIREERNLLRSEMRQALYGTTKEEGEK